MQLSFDLHDPRNNDPYSEEYFANLPENSAAISFLEKFFGQENFALSQFQSLILRGPDASGKTHLVNIFAKKFHAKFLKIEQISKQNLSEIFNAHQFYILEDLEKINDEELALHLINLAVEKKAFLLLTSKNKSEFHLKDLTSRVKNIFSLTIKDPSLKTIEILLVNYFARRQIKVSNRIINFVSKNIERSYAAIFSAVNLIEINCRENKKNPSLQEVEEILSLTESTQI